MAHFRRPVPMIFCAANPPGSLDLTNFSRLIVSIVVDEATTMAGVLETRTFSREGGFLEVRVRVRGLEEMWVEKERAEKDEDREEIDMAMFDLIIRKVKEMDLEFGRGSPF